MKIIPRVETKGVIYKNDDVLYHQEALKTSYYNFYQSYGAHYKPKSVYEIGVRAGYTAYYLLKGSGATKYRGIDLETYKIHSNDLALPLVRKVCKDSQIELGSSHALEKLDQLYDLIHIDGDHSFHGKVQDLELSLASLAPGGVIVVDDYNAKLGIEVKKATDVFAEKHNLKLIPLKTFTGHALLERQ